MASALIGLLALLLVAPFLASAAAPLVWWVRTPEEGAEVALALREVWPQAPIHIQVGVLPPGAPGVSLDPEAGLRFSDGESEQVRSGVLDAQTAAALVRSWYIPPLEVLPLPPPRPPAAEAPPAPRGEVGFVAGPASRRPDPGPAFHLALQAASPRWLVVLELDPAERVRPETGSTGGLVVRRLGVTGGVRLTQPVGGGWLLEEAASLGLRLHTSAAITRPDVLALLPLPSGALRVRLWSPTEAAGPRLGGGVMASYDGLSARQWYDAEQTFRLRPLTLAVEFGVLGSPSR